VRSATCKKGYVLDYEKPLRYGRNHLRPHAARRSNETAAGGGELERISVKEMHRAKCRKVLRQKALKSKRKE